MALDFPLWLRGAHYFNLLFLSISARSGLQILSAHPKLYWNDHCTPGSEWLRLTRKRMPRGALWTSRDEEEAFPSWVALPGGRGLGLGRHWHFLGDLGWILTGIFYVVLLFAADEWRRLVPTSWSIVPAAWQAFVSYATLHLPEAPGGYNALQQLAYFGVVFILAPLTIATGLAMSPAISARFPSYIRLFHGRQAARSVHFLCLCAFMLFLIVHVVMVVLHGLARDLALIVLGETQHPQGDLALVLALVGIAAIVAFHLVATRYSRRHPDLVYRRTGAVIDVFRHPLLAIEPSPPRYGRADVSPFFRVNGRPPRDAAYEALAAEGFAGYALEVGGLVERPLRLTLAELRRMPREAQITLHCCIQGWSAIAEWGGVPFRHVLELCRPLPQARFVLFEAFDDKGASEPDPAGPGRFYGTVELRLARHPMTLLADEMNGTPLPIVHGAPLRIRIETQLGFTMVKYLRSIALVADYRSLGKGRGGWREDWQFYDQEAGI
jgi:DMSO/TMAO reductase YedYZ molybdopterin-dependent catalytic subunit/thiosulfate reductase cytochrome b subunit